MAAGMILVGAGGLAREVIAAGCAGVRGILDDDESLHGSERGGVPVLGGIERAAELDGQLLVCVGPSEARRRVVRKLSGVGVRQERYGIFVAPSVRIGSTCSVGPGSILLDGVVITSDASLGSHVVAMPNCTVTHDDVLADFVTLAAGVALGGSVRVGEAAYLGMNASVRQGLMIGQGATVGMGAVVLSDIPGGQTWAGVPARRLGEAS